MTNFKGRPSDQPHQVPPELTDRLASNHNPTRLDAGLYQLLAACTTLKPEARKLPTLRFPKQKTVLCSASPRRRALLALTGRPFVCKAPDPEFEQALVARLNEPAFLKFKGPVCSFEDAAMRSIYLAGGKARQICREDPDSYGFWIGADTFIWYDRKILEKPTDKADARAMLRRLSGQKHLVITGISVLARGLSESENPPEGQVTHSNGKRAGVHLVERCFFHSTAVSFRPLDTWQKAYIDTYVASGSPLDKAGAYGIQDSGALLIEGIEGDYQNVVGLPVARLARLLDALEGKTKV